MPVILVVDDDPINQRILNYSLTKAGYQTLLASNGEIALEFLGAQEVDLAIMDYSMPVMDGAALLRRVRSIPKYERLPVIMFSGNDTAVEQVEEENLGVQGFLTKPSSSKMILEMVRGLLGQIPPS